jgi:hypothetical protein
VGRGGQQYLQIDFGETVPIDDISIVWEYRDDALLIQFIAE